MAHQSEHNLSIAAKNARRDGRAEDAAHMEWALSEIKQLRADVVSLRKLWREACPEPRVKTGR